MNAISRHELWDQIFRADEANLAYFAERVELPGVVLFCSEREDAPEFDVAVIYRVAVADADKTLQSIVDQFRHWGRRPRVRLGPLSTPADWPTRLQRAGFSESSERFVFVSVPDTVRLEADPAVRVVRCCSPDDAARFSAIQAVGFDIPPHHVEWDLELARRHVITGQHTFYLAVLDARPVGAARSAIRLGGPATMAALVTLPDARGRGVGTALLGRMIEDARLAGSTTISAATIPGSYAVGMYERLGFVQQFATRTFEVAA